MPTERALWEEHGVARVTVRQAYAILRAEGIAQVRPPYGTYVRHPERRRVVVPRGSSVRVIQPSPEERRTYGVPEGVAVVLLTLPSGEVQSMAADEVELSFS